MAFNYKNFKPNYNAPSTRVTIPAGAYIGKVIKAQEEEFAGHPKLAIMVEVTEGEYKDHYKKDYEASKGGKYEARYKGILRLNIPTENSLHPDWDQRGIENALGAVQLSNGTKFKWDGDLAALKGMAVGIVIREREYEVEGNTGITTEICAFAPVQDVRDGKVKTPKMRKLRGTQTDNTFASVQAETAPAGFTPVGDEEEDFPF